MVKEIRIYFEGDPALREGFHQFLCRFIERARENGIRVRLVAGRGRVLHDFAIALATHPGDHVLLLTDSDGPVGVTPRQWLASRPGWEYHGVTKPDDAQIHLMVQVMEAWFLADVEALQRFYGAGFLPGRLPHNPQVEEIPKEQVLNGLKGATEDTSKGEYHKTRHAPELLKRIDPAKVAKAAPHCRRFLDTLDRLLP